MDNPSFPIRRSVRKNDRTGICKFSFPLLLLFLFVAKPVFSLNPDRHISQYGHTAWRVQDGYFGGKVRKITQTSDGYIWVGTEAGLFRFDGVRFVPWSSLAGEQLSSTYIIALRGARDGSLWIGTDDGLAHWVNQRLITYLKGDFVTDILEDENGGTPAIPPVHSAKSSIQRFDVTGVTTEFRRSTHSLWRRTPRAIFGSVVTQNFSAGGSGRQEPGSDHLKSTA